MREFGLWHPGAGTNRRGFVEDFAAIWDITKCTGTARHDADPGCAIREAIENGAIAETRFENYREFLKLWRR